MEYRLLGKRFVLCNAGIFSFSSFAFGPKFSSKIMASAALNITFSRCVCLHPEYETREKFPDLFDLYTQLLLILNVAVIMENLILVTEDVIVYVILLGRLRC